MSETTKVRTAKAPKAATRTEAPGNSLQAITVAVNSAGINDFFAFIAPVIMQQSFPAPDRTGLGAGQVIPIGLGDNIELSCVNVFNGVVTNVDIPNPPAVTQNSDGSLTVTLTGSFDIAYGVWVEMGVNVQSNIGMPPTYTDFDNMYYESFSFTISHIEITFTVEFIDTGRWSVQITNPSQKNVSVGQINLPRDSVLNGASIFGCVNTIVRNTVRDAIADQNYAQNLATALNNQFGTIPNSGNISSDITFDFSPSSPITYFTGAAGMAVGLSGQVSHAGAPYAGPAPDTPIPNALAARDIYMNVSAYELNALFWAFYESGSFTNVATAANSGNAAILNTSWFREICPNLYDFAPNAPMTLGFQATSAPVVSTVWAYSITAEGLSNLQWVLGPTAYAALQSLIGVIYSTEDALNQALQSVLTPTEYQNFAPIFDQMAMMPAVSLTTQFQVVVNVERQGQFTPAFVFDVERVDMFSEFTWSAARHPTGALCFAFSDAVSIATLGADSVPGGVSQDVVTMCWTVISDFVDIALSSIGTTGVPLPNISGFSFRDLTVAIILSGGYLNLGFNIDYEP